MIHLNNNTKMVGRTKAGDPVWRNQKGKKWGTPFLIENGETIKPMRWWHRERWVHRKLKAPLLAYGQVAEAQARSKKLLEALRRGPLTLRRGFIYDRANRPIMTKTKSAIVIHWMEGCGIVFTRQLVGKDTVRLDLDVEATEKNNVR